MPYDSLVIARDYQAKCLLLLFHDLWT